MADTSALLADFHHLASRIFNDNYLSLMDIADSSSYADKDVDACVRFISDLVYSPPRLADFLSMADPGLLSSVYKRYITISKMLNSRRFHASLSNLRSGTDGAILRAFLIDMWQAFSSIPGVMDEFD